MKTRATYCWIFMALMLVFACSEIVDLNVTQEGGQLVIYGRLTDGTFGTYVSVARTGGRGGPQRPVLGATVSISDGSGNVQTLIPGDSGIYELPPNFTFGQVGESYQMQVSLEGKSYDTAPQVMPENYGRETMSFENIEVESISSDGVTISELVVAVSANTTFDELPGEFYLRWDVEEAYTYLGTDLPPSHFLNFGAVQCYVIRDLNQQKIFLHNGKENRATEIPKRRYVNRLVDNSFEALHYFNLIRSSMSQEAFEYWERLDQLVNRQGSIFDVPPAAIPGNIISEQVGEEVLGFFEVINADTTRLPITRNDVPYFIFDPCQIRGADEFLEVISVPRNCRECLVDRGILPADCVFCGRSPNNQFARPSYF